MLLLVEDDLKIAKPLIQLFQKHGYSIDHASSGEQVFEFLALNDYDVIILDWMLPEIQGIDICKMLRRRNYLNGILMLTAKDTLENKLDGFDAGADDYLVKPFEFQELLARVKSLILRSQKFSRTVTKEIGDFKIDSSLRNIRLLDENLNLSNREYQVLELLLLNNGNIIPREMIIDKVWGLDQDVTSNNLDAFIRLLRKKLGKISNKHYIKNVRGIGYKMEV